jgi:hypothetical protein
MPGYFKVLPGVPINQARISINGNKTLHFIN